MRPVALVTGGGTGIGAAIVERLALDGMDILSAGRNIERLQEQHEDGLARGLPITAVQMDATDRASVAAALEPHPRIDVLVNNAGIYTQGPFMEAQVDELQRMFVGNVQSVLVVSQEVVPKMPEGGRIINIASRAAQGAPNQTLYAPSKAAVVTLTRVMSLELTQRGILVNSVSPGLIRSPMTDGLPPDKLEAILRMVPIGRLGEPAEVASVVSMLAGPGGGYTNGEDIIVDAGRSAGYSPLF